MNQQDQLDENIARYVQKLAVNPEQPEIHFQLGNLYVKKQQWQLAIKSYEQAIHFNPQLIKAYSYLARLYETKLNNTYKSTDYWYQAIKLNPDSVTAEKYLILGNILAAQKKLEKAIDCYQQAITISPNFLDACHRLAELLLTQNQPQTAIQTYQKGVRCNPQNSQFHWALTQALAKQKQWKLANQHYQNAIALEKDLPARVVVFGT